MKVTIEKQKVDSKTWERILRNIEDVALLKEIAKDCDEKEACAIINNPFITGEILDVIYEKYVTSERFLYVLSTLLGVDIPQHIIHKLLTRPYEILPFWFAQALAKQKEISTEDLEILFCMYQKHMSVETLAGEIAVHPNVNGKLINKMANTSKKILLEILNKTDLEFQVNLKNQ